MSIDPHEIQAARLRYGHTYEAGAKAIGVSMHTFWRWCKGKFAPSRGLSILAAKRYIRQAPKAAEAPPVD